MDIYTKVVSPTARTLAPQNNHIRPQVILIHKSLRSSDKVILPESVFNEIMREFANPPNPIILKSTLFSKMTNQNRLNFIVMFYGVFALHTITKKKLD